MILHMTEISCKSPAAKDATSVVSLWVAENVQTMRALPDILVRKEICLYVTSFRHYPVVRAQFFDPKYATSFVSISGRQKCRRYVRYKG